VRGERFPGKVSPRRRPDRVLKGRGPNLARGARSSRLPSDYRAPGVARLRSLTNHEGDASAFLFLTGPDGAGAAPSAASGLGAGESPGPLRRRPCLLAFVPAPRAPCPAAAPPGDPSPQPQPRRVLQPRPRLRRP